MYARATFMHLKPDCVASFTRTFADVIIPLLRTQVGFKDQITLVGPCESIAMGFSLWDQKDDADAYDCNTRPEVLKALVNVLEEAHHIGFFRVSNSTFHQIAAGLNPFGGCAPSLLSGEEESS